MYPFLSQLRWVAAIDLCAAKVQCVLSPFFTVRLARLENTKEEMTAKLFRVGATGHDAVRFYFGCEGTGARDATQVLP